MRLASLLLGAALAAAPLASASAAIPISDVSVKIGGPLAAKSKEYGARELDWLAAELRSDVQRALSAKGLTGGGGRLELTIVDAKPNRPTFAQMARTPGLSMESLSIGGARIEGYEVAPDGARRPVSYEWYETRLQDAVGSVTWSDAETAFERFASGYAAGRR
jgi:hypothetical protein